MQKLYFIAVFISIFVFTTTNAQVGIGTTTPNAAAALHVEIGTSQTTGLLVTGVYNNLFSATVPDLGQGPRMMFYPGKAAFRAGFASGTGWDNINVGQGSVALGSTTKASGNYSTALGFSTTASGAFSNAMGYSNLASGHYSTAIGNSNTASGENSIAMGYQTIASGLNSTAIGYKVSTNNQTGALIIGDSDPLAQGPVSSGFPDEFVARFNNGYYFLTSGNINRFGVSIGHYGNAWVSICDKNRKENFEELDGEDVLQKISKINFTSWNYKMQDPKIYRHYGIMAQDFYRAFGHDKFGSIGNDTTVNPIDMIGIDMTAIKALEKRTENLKGENLILQQSVTQLVIAFNEQKKLSDIQQIKIDKLESQIKELLKR